MVVFFVTLCFSFPQLSATDLDSTLESEVSGAEGDNLMKSTPRDPGPEAGGSRGSTPDEMLATRSFAEVVRGIPPIVSEEEMREKEERIHQVKRRINVQRNPDSLSPVITDSIVWLKMSNPVWSLQQAIE